MKEARFGELPLDDHTPGSGSRYAHRGRVCRGTLPGFLLPGGSTGNPLREHQHQLAEYRVPVLTAGAPVLHNPPQEIVIGKRRLVFRDSTELPVHTNPQLKQDKIHERAVME